MLNIRSVKSLYAGKRTLDTNVTYEPGKENPCNIYCKYVAETTEFYGTFLVQKDGSNEEEFMFARRLFEKMVGPGNFGMIALHGVPCPPMYTMYLFCQVV